MHIFVRLELARPLPPTDEPALLLEGSWPEAMRTAHRDSLDAAIDARHGWIDSSAAELAARLAEDVNLNPLDAPYPTALLANLGALRLRYFFVKLLRWVAYCRDVRPPVPGERWLLHADDRDQAYHALFRELCAAYRVRGEVLLHGGAARSKTSASQPIARWRRALSPWVAVTPDREAPHEIIPGQRVLFCGDSNLLGPLCREVSARGQRAAWLCDEPVLKLKLRMPRVLQLVCESSRARENDFARIEVPALPTEEGIDLAAPVRPWLEALRREQGPRWSHWLRAIDHHVRAFRPDALLVGEDATPFSRAAVLVARRHGVRSVVAQHGAPAVRFGFAPMLADAFAAWDVASRRQLIDWGVAGDRVLVAGSLALEPSQRRIASRCRRQPLRSARTLLWLASLPARDDRPDAVEYHLTSATHAAMLRAAGDALAALRHVRVIIRPHPRDADLTGWRNWLEQFPSLNASVIRRGRWTDWLAQADAVLSCGSSAGLEAARLGWPVVQLLPAGSGDLLNAERWGLIGTARSEAELRPLLTRALRVPVRRVQDTAPRSAAARIADWIMASPGRERVRTRLQTAHEETLCLPT